MSEFFRLENGRLAMRSRYTDAAPVEISDGPWHAEPDRVEFEHQGLPCLLLRGPSGTWCGYVGMPPGHRWHGVDYDDVRVPRRDPDDEYSDYPLVHGGLTYARPCSDEICHVPREGQSDAVWWLGFDCSHAGDISLYNETAERKEWSRKWWRDHHDREPPHSDVYRTVEYARRETEKLAEQAAAIGGAS